MKTLRLPLLTLALLCWGKILSAQDMEVTDANTPPITPEGLISNIFLGDGVEVLDITFDGDPQAVGYFTNALEEVGIERGIIMTSGRAAGLNCGTAPGAACVGTDFSTLDNASTASDPDLTAISTGGLGIFDACKFSITFIPTSDTLRFKYVFASEEYPEWACTSFNDVFGFFISGPGINGTFENNGINIAQIPGTNLPVTINNVHPQNGGCAPAFAQYYNSHEFSNEQPVYDGYLDVFIAEAVVIPCSTYTIKLMVSDVGDGIFDTGVFLEAKSFGTAALDVDIATVSLDGTVTEGCANGTMTFSFPGALEEDFPLDFTIIGSAENGVDYQFIDPNQVILAGDSSITLDIIGIDDGIDEPLESIGIDIQRDICNRDTFWIFIRDNEILPPDLGDDLTICQGDTVALDGTLPIPLPVPPSFTNSTDMNITTGTPTYSNIQVAGVQPTILGPGVIQSVCVNITHKWVDDLDLYLISPSGQFIELSSDNGANCDNYNVCFTPTAAGPIDYAFPWPVCGANIPAGFNGGTFQPEGVWSDLWDGEYATNGIWQLLVHDDQQGFNGTLLDWTITFEPLYQVYYAWSPTDGLSCTDCPDPIATPQQTTTYTLTAWDSYGCEVYDSITIEVNDVLPPPNVNCSAVTDNSITFSWDDVPGAQGYEVSLGGGPWIAPNNGPTSQIVTGLTLSDSVVIQVRAISNCDGEIGQVTCSTPACNAPALSIVSQQDVNCPDDTNGAVTVTATGGAGGYTYALGGTPNTTGVFNNLPPGLYNVVVVDAWNCPNSITVSIDSPDPLELQPVLIQDVTCFGNNDGSVTVEVEGGVMPYSFDWGNVIDSVLTNLPPGTYTVDVTDANGCDASLSLDVAEPALLALNIAADSTSCNGLADGAALVLVAGGTEPYLFQWDAAANNATTALANDLAAGTYDVSVTDLNGCMETITATVLEPTAISSNASFVALSCADGEDGTASITASGGTPGYQFFWENGDLSPTADSLAAATYMVTISDANSCTATNSVTLTAPPPMSLTLTPTAAECFGENSGGMQVQFTGGTGNWTFEWSTGLTTQNLANVPADTYCVTATDANGCTIEACADVEEPDELLLSSQAINAGCNGGSEGSINLTVNGGTGPFDFDWNNGQFSTEDINGLAAGSYTVLVTDANGCSTTLLEEVSETDAIALTLTDIPVKCKGGEDGSISLNATGGSGGFSFLWTGPGGFTSSQEDPGNLAAGTYVVIVEDVNDCSATASIVITEPATAVEASIAQPQEICFNASNGTAEVSAVGGNSPYEFEWSDGQSNAEAVGLMAGTYSVTVSDLNGCEDVATVDIEQQPEIILSLAQTAPDCHDGTNGTANIAGILQGGSPVSPGSLSIAWSAGGQSTPNISGLTGGQSYTVTVTNSLGCTASESVTVGNPSAIEALIVSTEDVRCKDGSDGSATATGSGGTTPYSYLWSASAGGQTTATASGLRAGDYAVTVTDSKGCNTVASTSLTEPPALSAIFENEKVLCNGGSDGSSVAFPEGGVQPYTLAWSSGDVGNEASDLAAGIYQLTLTDANGCTLVEETEVKQPEQPLAGEYSVTNVSCFGYKDGMIHLEMAGGSPPYRYSLDGENFNGSATQIALVAGDYNAYITDKNGCPFQFDDILVGEPEQLMIELGEDTTVLYDYTAVIDPLITGYDSLHLLTFDWSSNNPQTPPKDATWPKGFFEHVVSPATVFVTITTPEGCQAEDLMQIFVKEFRSVQVPTGFAPGSGGNALNDLLHVHGSTFMVEKVKRFQVFDRWGELMFELTDFLINDTAQGWDGTFKGKEMPAGVYIWTAEVDFKDGSMEHYKGETTLIR